MKPSYRISAILVSAVLVALLIMAGCGKLPYDHKIVALPRLHGCQNYYAFHMCLCWAVTVPCLIAAFQPWAWRIPALGILLIVTIGVFNPFWRVYMTDDKHLQVISFAAAAAVAWAGAAAFLGPSGDASSDQSKGKP